MTKVAPFHTIKQNTAFAAVGLCFMMTGAQATEHLTEDGLLREDPNRDVAGISADLNVSEEEFTACFWNVNPEVSGEPSGERQAANKAILLPCLQAANPDITNDFLDQVMNSHRPANN